MGKRPTAQRSHRRFQTFMDAKSNHEYTMAFLCELLSRSIGQAPIPHGTEAIEQHFRADNNLLATPRYLGHRIMEPQRMVTRLSKDLLTPC